MPWMATGVRREERKKVKGREGGNRRRRKNAVERGWMEGGREGVEKTKRRKLHVSLLCCDQQQPPGVLTPPQLLVKEA